MYESQHGSFFRLIAVVGLASAFLAYLCQLLYWDMADYDIWARLSIGASVWKHGTFWDKDPFAFTPTLPHWIDHEWGTGVFYFAILKCLGAGGLMAWKCLAGVGSLAFSLLIARRNGARATSLTVLAMLCAPVIMSAYVVVARPQTVTFLLFPALLWLLEEMRRGARWPAFVIPPMFLLWTNMHGGFLAGLGVMGVYGLFAIGDCFLPGNANLLIGAFPKDVSPQSDSLDVPAKKRHSGEWRSQEPLPRLVLLTLTGLAAFALTFLNPWGWEFWPHLLQSVAQPRPGIKEWRPLSLFESDTFNAFRVAFPVVLLSILIGWRRLPHKHWPGLAMLALTTYLTFSSRRHAPFFGVAAAAFAAPWLEATAASFATHVFNPGRRSVTATVAVLSVLSAAYALPTYLAHSAFTPLAQRGNYPVREADILAYAGLKGNLATPFGWGSYLQWRLYPDIRISMDGRYEAAFPEETNRLNADLHFKNGPDWDRMLHEYPVDFIILDNRLGRVRSEDLIPLGYTQVFADGNTSALLVKNERMDDLRKALPELPHKTIDPFDPSIPDRWPAP